MALFVGLAAGAAEGIIESGQQGAIAGKPDKLLKFNCLVTWYGATYVTALLLYRWFGATGEVAELWQGVRGRQLAILNAIGGVWLVARGWRAMLNAMAPRPSLIVGLLLLWLSARGVLRTSRSSSHTTWPRGRPIERVADPTEESKQT